MKRARALQKISLLFSLAIMVLSLFLPFYASTSNGPFHSSFVVLGVFKEHDDYFSIYTGFNSLFGMLNLLSSAVIALLSFLYPAKTKTLAIILLSILIASLLLIKIEMLLSGLVLSPAAKMLTGFYVLTIGEVILIGSLFNWSRQFQKNSNEHLLDDPA